MSPNPTRVKRGRGRPPRKGPPLKPTSVRVSEDVLDRYCQLSHYTGKDVRVLMREILELHAPVICRISEMRRS